MEDNTRMNIPVVALRGLTVFPNQTLSFDVERDISIFALDHAMESDRRVFLVTQREISTAKPTESDLYAIGTICHILQIIKTSNSVIDLFLRSCTVAYGVNYAFIYMIVNYAVHS